MTDSLFRIIFENSQSGMLILGKDQDILYYNQAFLTMIGCNGSQTSVIRFSELLLEEEKEAFTSRFDALVRGEQKALREELKYVPGNSTQDSVKWFLLELTRETDPETGKHFIFGILNDITQEKEGKLKLINEKENAEKATRVKSDFLANMSHEIRTPIHTIIGMNELLLETKLDEEQVEYAEQVKFAADVLLSLINDILDVSKIEAGKLHLEDIEFDLHEMVGDAVDLISLEAHKKGLETALYIAKGVPKNVIGDPVRIRQIIVNLFNNAIKFTKEGEIVVNIKKKQETDDDYILYFHVRDTGIGIPEDKVNRLFQAFSQVDTSTTRKFGGTGLGLSISKNLVQMMHGDIGVKSTYGEGSTFYFTIRVEKVNGQEEQPYLPDDYDIKALVVDDNDTARSIVLDYVKEWGVTSVEGTTNGHDALQRLREEAHNGRPFNLCIVDLLMPGMDGWQFASEVNADKNINSTKMVLLSPTGKSGDEAKMKLLHWYDAYLSKPLKKGDLYNCLVKIMKADFDLEAVEEVEPVEEEATRKKSSVKGLMLVAEDHEVNQQLFQTILENLGHEVRLANNGVEAVEAVEKEDFSIIFMDVQMPEMNGYEATEKIREKNIETPIIAATASAVKGEQEKCLASGMNDILVKPFTKKDIAPLLEKWMTDGGEAQPVQELEPADETAAPTGEETATHAESTYIFDFDSAVENFMGKKETVKKVVGRFIDKVENQFPTIEEALDRKDLETVRSEAHSIKGGAWNLAVKKLGDTAKNLEDSSREEKQEDSRNNFEQLKDAYQEFRRFVDPLLEEE